ncbi:Arc family DNA-binding protein [Paracoccus sediminis]|uniref:Arc family DNA-binding protein n=2 Tax=Paracoccus sediminis TaxID=1214787 RepID=A0ABY1YIR4_9RHOB|nr:Arc family DNA-binding protein [Paracoccus sediminis]TBN47557.1 Arc family DNA-binding protein [Paracoccus sediminis]
MIVAGPIGRESDKFMLRLPEGMRNRIKSVAEANNRSMNAEIIATLEDAFPPLITASEAQIEEALRSTRDALYSSDLTEDQKDQLWNMMMKVVHEGGF